MLKAGLISCWEKNRNKHSGSNLNLSSHTNLPCENCCFVGYWGSTRQKDFGILKMLSEDMWQKKWIDKVTKSRVLNEVSLKVTSTKKQ